MAGRHAPRAMCVQGPGLSAAGCAEGLSGRKTWGQTDKQTKNLAGPVRGRCIKSPLPRWGGEGARTPFSREQCLAVTSHLHPSVRGNVREDAWWSPPEGVSDALCHWNTALLVTRG